jgi:hypothetical protein
MRTRTGRTLAGVVVVVTLGGLGALPVGAQDAPAPGDDAAADTPDPGPADPTAAAGGDASADDGGAPADGGSTATDPGGTGPDGTDPDGTDPDGTATDPGTGGGAATDPATDPADDPATAPPTDPASGAGPEPAPGTGSTDPTASADPADGSSPDDPAASPPAVVDSQEATVDAHSTAVADTGHNTAANGAVQIIVADQTATAGGGAGGPGGAADPSAGNSAGGGNTGVGLALVVSGDAAATGGATDDTISQKALVKAVGTGEIEIIQIALVVNLGVGIANTGGNTATGLDAVNVIGIGQGASAGDGAAGGTASNGLTATNDASGNGAITTGDATAVGNTGSVQVTQAADAAAGSGLIISDQATDITNLGVAFGNTGLNLVIGNAVLQLILVDQAAGGGSGGAAASAGNAATATNSATGRAAVTTGGATATGNASSTTIDQLAVADAADGGFVSILQRALVLNLGIALANTGMNTAVGNQSVNLVQLQQQSIAGAFWSSLQSLFGGSGWLDLPGSGTATNSVTAANTSDGAAVVRTGEASATGLASTTEVAQQATGSAGAGGQAHVTQDATVTNAGLAIANTGANDAAGLLALNAVIAGQWAGLGDFLSGYLTQLGAGSTTASPATSSWALGDVLVDLFGEIHADEVLLDGFAALSGGQVEAAVAQALGFAAGFDDIEGTGPGGGPRIRVRQVTGNLTINLGIASTGSNTAESTTVNVVVVDQESRAASESEVSNALGRGVRAALQAVVEGNASGDTELDPANLAVLVNAATGSAVIVTGDATAANSTVIAVCQTFEVSPAVCSPVEPPVTPGTPGTPGSPGTPGTPGAWTDPIARPPSGSGGWMPAGGSSRGIAGTMASLPRTGADTAPLAQAGAVLVAAGALLVAAARRRALVHRPAHLMSSPDLGHHARALGQVVADLPAGPERPGRRPRAGHMSHLVSRVPGPRR